MCEYQKTSKSSERKEKFLYTLRMLVSPESRITGANYKPGANDIIISTAPKAGTTFMQQICHELRSHGDMGFEEISLVVPSLEMAQDYGYENLYAKQPFQPQMFSTHFDYHSIPKGAGKYIVLVRNPADAALSFFHFFENWIFQKDEISLQEFIEWFWLQDGAFKSDKDNSTFFHHIMSWYPHRLDRNVLWLHYEDLRQDLRKCVRLIAQFLEIGGDDEELQELVVRQSSLEFVKNYPSKFDTHMLKLGRNERAGLPKEAGLTNNSGKVRTGLVNQGRKVIPSSSLARIDRAWTENITTITGYNTYEDFRNGINKELNRNFN